MVTAVVTPIGNPFACAQQLTGGFEKTTPIGAPSVEISRQRDYWMMEVQLKPMRMIFIDVPNSSGEGTTQEEVWYLTWRASVRPVDAREQEDQLPENTLDAPPGPMPFIPSFTLIGYDDPKTEIPTQSLQDEIIPAAMAKIRQIERGPYRNTVQVIQPVPEPISADAEEQKWIYGVTTWRGVDPDTDFFKVIFGGFTNGYEVRKHDDSPPQIWRKVFVQKFARPGDRFDPNQREFQFAGNPHYF